MSEKTVLITGATEGIGRATALNLAAKNYDIYIVARNESKGNKVLEKLFEINPEGNHKLFIADLSDVQSVNKFLDDYLKIETKLDLLILSAGVFDFNKEGADLIFKVNYLSRYMIVTRLNDLLKRSKSAKVIYLGGSRFVNIRFDKLSNPDYNKMFAIWQASTANVILVKKLNYSKGNVKHIYWCPGIVNTALVKSQPYLVRKLSALFGMLEPEQAADNLWKIISEREGEYFLKLKAKKFPKKSIFEKEYFNQLIKYSEEKTLVSLSF